MSARRRPGAGARTVPLDASWWRREDLDAFDRIGQEVTEALDDRLPSVVVVQTFKQGARAPLLLETMTPASELARQALAMISALVWSKRHLWRRACMRR